MQQYDRREERTGVQEHAPYARRNDVQCDFVMVYGLDDIKNRVKEWKRHGYVVHLMTGVSWGEYQDYLYGKFDGRDHHDEGQVDGQGREINHGKDVPYMVPTISFADYLTQKLKVAVDAGVEAIHLEEPEFWAQAGYSEAFKREWLIYYKEPWQDPQATAEGQYRASRLKQYLYARMLDRLCSALKEYALVKYGRLLRFYVPTHSLINYSQWKIVSPESALIDLPGVDGYIAQIWTGTSRTKNCYEGVVKERTFETAFLEYGVMQELVRGTGRKMWFLHDPIEDDPTHTWRDYRENYYRTVTASLLHPGVDTYEVAPWPNRIFGRSYPKESGDGKEPIPAEYATNLLTVMHTLRDMRADHAWEGNMQEIGLLLADSGMFQRIYPRDDARHVESQGSDWSSFYGLALPLLKRGLAVRPLQLDNVRRYPAYLDGYKALVLSYEFMKPESPDIHTALGQWVADGGVLVYVGDSSDCFHAIRHWWNQGTRHYTDPAQHLFEVMGLPGEPADGLHSVGRGYVVKVGRHPTELAAVAQAAESYRQAVRQGLEAAGLRWHEGNQLVLRRGRYVVAAAMDESLGEAVQLHGRYVDLYQANLDIVENPALLPGSVGLYLDLAQVEDAPADILAISARADRVKMTSRSLRFRATGPEGVACAARIALRRAPGKVTATLAGAPVPLNCRWDEATGTALLCFDNSPDGVSISIVF